MAYYHEFAAGRVGIACAGDGSAAMGTRRLLASEGDRAGGKYRFPAAADPGIRPGTAACLETRSRKAQRSRQRCRKPPGNHVSVCPSRGRRRGAAARQLHVYRTSHVRGDDGKLLVQRGVSATAGGGFARRRRRGGRVSRSSLLLLVSRLASGRKDAVVLVSYRKDMFHCRYGGAATQGLLHGRAEPVITMVEIPPVSGDRNIASVGPTAWVF